LATIFSFLIFKLMQLTLSFIDNIYKKVTTMDTEYLKTQLGDCLVECLSEVSEKRPLDPIEYIGQWLYKFMENKQHARQEEANVLQLIEEKKQHVAELERQARMADEKQRLAKEDSERAKALEAEQVKPTLEESASGQLATVLEKEEPVPEAVPEQQTQEEVPDEQTTEGIETEGPVETEEPAEGEADATDETAAEETAEEPAAEEEAPAE